MDSSSSKKRGLKIEIHFCFVLVPWTLASHYCTPSCSPTKNKSCVNATTEYNLGKTQSSETHELLFICTRSSRRRAGQLAMPRAHHPDVWHCKRYAKAAGGSC